MEKTISFVMNEKMGTFFITMLSALSKQEATFDVGSDESGLFVKQRNPDDIIKFKFNKDLIKAKVFDWLSTGNPNRRVELNAEETEIFRQCAHAAYYYITEGFDNPALAANYIEIYQTIFGKPSED